VDAVLGPASSLELRIGRPVWEYQSNAPEQFRSLVTTLAWRRNVPAGTQISVELDRNLYPAVFLEANHYTDERLSFSLSNDARARLVLGTVLAYYVNRYPTTDAFGTIDPIRRFDKTLDATAFIGFRMAGRMQWRLYARSEDRNSNVRGFGYRVGSVGATFTLGQ
jgi:hypothetical protein